MASKSCAISFQYFAICWVSSVFVLVPGIEIKILGRIGESAFAETGVISCSQHAPKTIKRLRQVGIVTESGLQTYRQTRLLGIDFPGMYVDHDGQTFFLHALQSQARVESRQQAKITAPTHRQIVPCQLKSSNRKLRHGAGRRLKTERCTRRSGHSIAIMMDGVNTGVVGESQFGQDIKRPHGTVD